MRRIVLRILLAVVCLGVLGLLWIFGGRQIALVLDRCGTIEIERIPITELSYEGSKNGGIFHVANRTLSTMGPGNHPLALSIAPDANNKLILLISGKSFPMGDLPASQESGATFTIRLDKDDEASLTMRRSFLSWPTPFDFNFMTGHAPSWKRQRYHQLVLQKRSGARLELLWRHEQYFYPNEGWTEGNMTQEGSTGLIQATINP